LARDASSEYGCVPAARPCDLRPVGLGISRATRIRLATPPTPTEEPTRTAFGPLAASARRVQMAGCIADSARMSG
jgi:hypothetical protein